MWYVRALPNVKKAFETAYGEPAVAAYDRPSVNLPTSSGNEASLRVAERSFEHGKLNAMELHTHFNQVSPPPAPPCAVRLRGCCAASAANAAAQMLSAAPAGRTAMATSWYVMPSCRFGT